MDRTDARKIAETITNEQLKNMIGVAKDGIKDWTKVSIVNKGFTKGVAWNMLAKDFDINYNHHILAKTNMVREFGEFLPNELKPKKEPARTNKQPVHRNPIFNK